jgi:TonB family protein
MPIDTGLGETYQNFLRPRAFSIAVLTILSIILTACGSPAARVQMDRGDGLGAESFAIDPRGPACPIEAENRKLDGLVVIQIEVNNRGRIQTAHVLGSPDKSLSDAALRSALTTSFRMPKMDGTQETMFGLGRLFFYFHCSSRPFEGQMPSDLIQKHS